jgi:hypothetical protein
MAAVAEVGVMLVCEDDVSIVLHVMVATPVKSVIYKMRRSKAGQLLVNGGLRNAAISSNDDKGTVLHQLFPNQLLYFVAAGAGGRRSNW